MMARMLCLGHSTADGLEDFRPAQLGDQKTEGVAACSRVPAHIAPGAGPPFDHPSELQFSQSAIDCRPRRPEALDKFRLTRKALAGLVLTGSYCISKRLTDSLVFGQQDLARHNLIIQ